MKLERYVADFIWNIQVQANCVVEKKKTWKDIWKESSKEGIDITKKVFPYVIL